VLEWNEPSGVAGGDAPVWAEAVPGPGALTPSREPDVDDDDLDDTAWYELAPMLLDPGRHAVNRPGPCRHCGRPVAFDSQGKPIHTSREYACRDPWGVLTNTHAELRPSVGRATVPMRRQGSAGS
jgi:hypothetical protein